MEKTRDTFIWKKLYSVILIANAIYILLFYLIMSYVS